MDADQDGPLREAELAAMSAECETWDRLDVGEWTLGCAWAAEFRMYVGELLAEVGRLQAGIREHRADITVPATGADWKLWSLLPEEVTDGR